ncbi:MAG: hypothetical protein JSV65_08040 [Armatimonadota bacterium]|nr:MAG: hypothetical protein JSV65_08040 [Armatimonadota bacterium]
MYRERVTLSDTAISRALNARHKQTCRHEWYLIDFGRGIGPLLREMEQGDYWTEFSVVRMLIRDDGFARELAQMQHPRQVWHALMGAGEKSPEDMHGLLGGWWGAGPDREPFADWWAANEERVRQLASGSRP